MDERNIISKYLDALPQIFFWELDEFMVVFALAGVGILIRQLTFMLFVGFGMAYLFGKFKDSKVEGFFLHFLYWYGVPVIKSKKLPNPNIKEFISF